MSVKANIAGACLCTALQASIALAGGCPEIPITMSNGPIDTPLFYNEFSYENGQLVVNDATQVGGLFWRAVRVLELSGLELVGTPTVYAFQTGTAPDLGWCDNVDCQDNTPCRDVVCSSGSPDPIWKTIGLSVFTSTSGQVYWRGQFKWVCPSNAVHGEIDCLLSAASPTTISLIEPGGIFSKSQPFFVEDGPVVGRGDEVVFAGQNSGSGDGCDPLQQEWSLVWKQGASVALELADDLPNPPPSLVSFDFARRAAVGGVFAYTDTNNRRLYGAVVNGGGLDVTELIDSQTDNLVTADTTLTAPFTMDLQDIGLLGPGPSHSVQFLFWADDGTTAGFFLYDTATATFSTVVDDAQSYDCVGTGGFDEFTPAAGNFLFGLYGGSAQIGKLANGAGCIVLYGEGDAGKGLYLIDPEGEPRLLLEEGAVEAPGLTGADIEKVHRFDLGENGKLALLLEVTGGDDHIYMLDLANGFCAADVNGDGVVDSIDLNAILSAFGTNCNPNEGCPADLNRDGTVDSEDLNLLLSEFGDPCAS